VVDDPRDVAAGGLEAAARQQPVHLARPLDRSLQRGQSVARHRRLLEALGRRQGAHAVGEALDDAPRGAGHRLGGDGDGIVVDPPVGGAGARAGGDAHLGRRTRRGAGRGDVRAPEPGRAAPQRQRRLQGLHHEGGHRPRRQRAEVQPRARRVLDDRQPRPRRVDVEPDVAVAVGAGAGPVVPRLEPGDQPGLHDLGGQRVREAVVPDRLGLAQHRPDLAAVLLAEVAAHPLAQVRRLADVEDLVAVPAEQVHPRANGAGSTSSAAWPPAGARPSRPAS